MREDASAAPRRAPERPPEAPAALPTHALLLIVALAAGVTGQGGYYAEGQRVMALMLGAALLFSLRVRPSSSSATWRGPRLAAGAVAIWALVSAAVAGDVAAAASFVALLVALVVVLVVCSRVTPPQRELLGGGVVAIGALVAVAGWVGVTWRIVPWALEDQALWRAASPLTYANATAGLLVAITPVALARLARRPARPIEAVAVCLLLVGVGATLSRAGLLSLLLGVLLLCALLGTRRVLSVAAGPVVGATIALAGLAASMPAHVPARPALSIAALVFGVGAAALRSRASAWAVTALMALGLVVAAVGASLGGAVSEIAEPRLTLASPDRSDETRAALDVAGDRPLTGAGPGGATLAWTDDDGRTLVAQYAHNEYLQILAELGVVGLALVLGLIASLALLVWRGRTSAASPELWAGVVAGLAALAFHSAFDFLWHIPVIPIVAAVLAGLTMQTTREEGL